MILVVYLTLSLLWRTSDLLGATDDHWSYGPCSAPAASPR
jgi:hypothetical protein